MAVRKAAAWMMAGQYATFVMQFATSVILSRLFLSPGDVGLFSIAFAAAMLVSGFQDVGITRFIVGQQAMRIDSVRLYAGVSVLIGWTIAVVLALLTPALAGLYHRAELAPILTILAASCLVSPLALVPSGLLVRDMRFGSLFAVNFGSAVIGNGTALVLAAHGFGAASLAWSTLAGSAARAALVLACRPVFPQFTRDWALLRPLLGFSAHSLVINASGIIGVRTPDMIVGRMLGPVPTGLFTRAGALAGQMSTLVTSALTSVFASAFARKRDAGDPLSPSYLHLVACNTAINWPVMLALALAAEPVVLLFYGPKWAGVAPLLRWTALGEALFVAVPLHMDLPILLGRIRQLIWVNWFDTAITIAVLITACLYGVEAAAFGRIIYAALWVVIYAALLSRLLGFRAALLVPIYARSALCALAAGAPLALAPHWLGLAAADLGWLRLIGLGLAGVPCWTAMVVLTGHPLRGEAQGLRAHLTAARAGAVGSA